MSWHYSLSVFFFKKKLSLPVIAALITGGAGVLCAAWPLLDKASVTSNGLLILLIGMLSYSAASIYFSAVKWNGLHLFTINGWQTLIGGALLLPLASFYYDKTSNHFDKAFWYSVTWLAIPVSIFAVLLWLWLLKTDTIKAGLWLFLCPLFGFAIAFWLLNDPISWYTCGGVLLVILGLALSQKSAGKNEMG